MTAASPDFVERLAALVAEFKAQDGAGQTQFNFWFSEGQILDLASGYVPLSVRGAMMAALDWAEDDRRRAGRPGPAPGARRPKTKIDDDQADLVTLSETEHTP